ncbi:LacI family DNA-binding transcriptional regulator [Paenibacillus thalictri]|uniref:LacI family transcriptional regulator n=1 Tax=Paenibacillus thalictri TaxID=2527873 RepID=A0A4Q9DXI4_9BACL|nr:LacI family DNA-binding transcriptional regulator [Paenibacillus thalictri]TBL81844.1 LacI family transcriptional regulator [Paenibacillus thalictri]
MSKRSVTIVDIAEAAGVSIATVSNVLNRRNVPMSEETIRKVEDTAKQLGYRRNVMAANLSRQKSYELGLIVPSFTGYYGQFAEEMERKANEHGYHMSVFSAGGMKPEMEKRHLEMLLSRRVDGLFCHGLAMSHESTRAVVSDGTPLVLFNGWGWPADIALAAVNLDFAGGSLEAVRHLVQQGCQSLVYVGRSKALEVNGQRLAGFKKGVEQYGGDLPVMLLDITDCAADRIVDEVIRSSLHETQPIGILVFDDYAALSVMSAALKRGLRVPDQVKISGINNDPLSTACYPALTTLDIAYDLQADIAIGKMLERLEEKPFHMPDASMDTGGQEIHIPMKLIQRESSGANVPTL